MSFSRYWYFKNMSAESHAVIQIMPRILQFLSYMKTVIYYVIKSDTLCSWFVFMAFYSLTYFLIWRTCVADPEDRLVYYMRNKWYIVSITCVYNFGFVQQLAWGGVGLWNLSSHLWQNYRKATTKASLIAKRTPETNVFICLFLEALFQ